MRVGLLVTGRMEVCGLPDALMNLFPTHDFYAITARSDGTPFDGFTSGRLPVSGAKRNVDKLVEALSAELVPGRKGDPPDFIFAIDDLELVNSDQPEVVVKDAERQLHLPTDDNYTYP